jgi:hypothetical protein
MLAKEGERKIYRKGTKRDWRKALELTLSSLQGFSLFVTPISQRTIPFW